MQKISATLVFISSSIAFLFQMYILAEILANGFNNSGLVTLTSVIYLGFFFSIMLFSSSFIKDNKEAS